MLIIAAQRINFATQDRATQKCDLSGVARLKAGQGTKLNRNSFLSSPAFLFFKQILSILIGNTGHYLSLAGALGFEPALARKALNFRALALY